MIKLHTPAEIEQMRAAGAFVRDTLAKLAAQAAVGVNLLDIELAARKAITEPRSTAIGLVDLESG